MITDAIDRALQLAADSGPLLVVVLDRAGFVVAVSPSVTSLLGWEEKDLLGGDSLDLVHPGDRGAVLSARQELAADRARHVEVRIRRRQGGWRVLEAAALLAPASPSAPASGATHDAHAAGSPGGGAGDGGSDVVVQAWDVTERWRRTQSLAHDATHDPLTQLPNRTLLMERLRAAHARQQRQPTPFALIYFDLDGFKAVNDTLGHAAGDRLLQDAAGVLAGVVRTQDVAARLGGDEFAVLVEDLHPDTAEQESQVVMVRARAGLSQLNSPGMVAAGASAGRLVVWPGDPRAPAALLADADQAMYEDKRARRSRRAVG